jgi:hypothetical protein
LREGDEEPGSAGGDTCGGGRTRGRDIGVWRVVCGMWHVAGELVQRDGEGGNP